MDLRKHPKTQPKNEMETRIQYEMDYLNFCDSHNVEPDFNRVMTGIANAYAAGIITGSCAPGFVFDFKEMRIGDHQFKILIEALITRGMNRDVDPDKMTFNFNLSKLTDESLFLLGKMLNHKRFPKHITLDLSLATGFTDAGAAALLAALKRETCNKSVVIKLPDNPRLISTALLKELNDQLKDNNANYNPANTAKVKTGKKGFFSRKISSDKKSVEKPRARRSNIKA